MLSFSGWTLLGSGSNALTQQGISLLMNNYVGLLANAAIGLCNQVNVAVSKFVSGFNTAFTPQVIKLYARDNYRELNLLISRSSKFSFALCYIMVLPLLCNMDFILEIWLGDDVPEYTAGFCRMVLICTLFDATTGVYNTAITATGRIRNYQILISLSFLLDLLLSFAMLYRGIEPVLVFSSRILTRGILNMVIGLYFINRYMGFDISGYIHSVLLKILSVIAITGLPSYMIYCNTSGLSRFLSTSVYAVIATMVFVLYFLMSKEERIAVLTKIERKFAG